MTTIDTTREPTPAEAAVGAPTRVIAPFGRPAWKRLLISREMAIVLLLVVVALVAMTAVRGFAANPMRAYAASGYQQLIAQERVGGQQASWGA
ncbi:hypothetical protein [Gulosibacter sediminis]|uniref:hypothetical protein n=1 Tax=Gulosibacter sediminis TaxID=1729695 RepID=UPI0024AD6483|nr:hypothetical protein [Gulosibacter sediminis]